MLSSHVVGCVFIATLVLIVDVASAASLNRRGVLAEESGTRTRREHVARCEKAKVTCLANYNRFSARNRHERVHCRISFDHCLNRWRD